MRRAERGLTLLEVLAAVAVLGLIYTVLAGAAIQGLRSEGESRRRIEASLLIDEQVVDIESQIAAGSTPEIGITESEVGDFRVAIHVRPLEFYESLTGSLEAAPENAPSVLGRGSAGGESPLRTIFVTVSWDEGVFERRIERTTFALDRDAAAGALAQLSSGRRGSRRWGVRRLRAASRSSRSSPWCC